MPVVVAIAIRYIIMAAVQLGLWALVEKYGIPLLNAAIEGIMKEFGVPEQTAKDIMANKILIAFEEVGIFAATLKTKLPIKVAEFLGFTSKGFVLRELGLATEAKIAGTTISATTKAAATLAEVEKISEVVSKSRVLNVAVVGSLWKSIMQNVSASAVVVLTVANVMDFANWQGAYQHTFQKIFSFFGFPPDTPMPKAGTLSPDTWKRIYSTVETLDPIAVNFAFSHTTKPYSRAALAEMIDEISANLIKNGTQATYKSVIAIALPLIQLKGKPDLAKMDSLSFSTVAVAPAAAVTKATSIPTTKVFTGLVSQGVVQPGLTFVERQDDMIDDADELKVAATNNLAPFLQALPGKVIYEIKIVSSITTKDGFTQRGTTTKIQTGTTRAGVPTYKSITNKFATLILYIMTDKGTRTKINTIVLGPVNSARFQVQQNDLQILQTSLPSLVTTTDIADITHIVSETPVATITPQGSPLIEKPKHRLGSTVYYRHKDGDVDEYVTMEWSNGTFSSFAEITKEEYIAGLQSRIAWAKDILSKYTRNSFGGYDLNAGFSGFPIHFTGIFPSQGQVDGWNKAVSDATNNIGIYAPDYVSGNYSKFQTYAPAPMENYYTEAFFNTLPAKEQTRLKTLYPNYSFDLDTISAVSTNAAQTSASASALKVGANATTLFEWYQAQGKSLPNVQERSVIYEQLGLGQSAYYTGTTEQNTKLLNALKK